MLQMRNVFALAGAIVIAACSAQKSPEYQRMSQLPREEWVQFAAQLPIERRFALYSEVYEASGHPKDSLLADSFTGTGQKGFDTALQRITSRENFFEFLPVIYAVGRGKDFNVCSEPARKRVQAAAERFQVEKSLAESIDFGKCRLYSPGTGTTAR